MSAVPELHPEPEAATTVAALEKIPALRQAVCGWWQFPRLCNDAANDWDTVRKYVHGAKCLAHALSLYEVLDDLEALYAVAHRRAVIAQRQGR